jgi:hypothetical protein
MSAREEIAVFLALAPFLLLLAFAKAPDLVAYWPGPVAISTSSAPTFWLAPDQIPGGLS